MEAEKINSISGEPDNQVVISPTHTVFGEYVGNPVAFNRCMPPWEKSDRRRDILWFLFKFCFLGSAVFFRILFEVCLMVVKVMLFLYVVASVFSLLWLALCMPYSCGY